MVGGIYFLLAKIRKEVSHLMTMKWLCHLASAPRRALTMAVLATSLVGLGAASTALATSPTGDFTVFSQCPRFTPKVNFCLYSQTKGGKVTLNKQTVPVTSTITLQGGVIRNEETEAETFVGALNGETLSKAPQKVPGGLAGLVKCDEIKGGGLLEKAARAACELVFENTLTGVNAVTELAKPAGEIGINKNNLLNEEGTALSLPVKIRLENPLLGSECYIGSSSQPIVWNLTTGTTSPPSPNEPITGFPGEPEFKDNFEIVELVGFKLVDNSFSAPEVTGCGGIFSSLLDPLIDKKIGLSSAAGKNTAILEGNLEESPAEDVIKSEE